MENNCDTCHKVSSFVSNYTVCLEKGHLPFSGWWTWLLNLSAPYKEQPPGQPGARPRRHVGLKICRKETTLGDMWSDEEPKVVGERAGLRGLGGRGRGPLGTVASRKGPHSQVMLLRWLDYLMNWSKLLVLKHKQQGSSTGCFFYWLHPEKF